MISIDPSYISTITFNASLGPKYLRRGLENYCLHKWPPNIQYLDHVICSFCTLDLFGGWIPSTIYSKISFIYVYSSLSALITFEFSAMLQSEINSTCMFLFPVRCLIKATFFNSLAWHFSFLDNCLNSTFSKFLISLWQHKNRSLGLPPAKSH